jgi:hypothetical protein
MAEARNCDVATILAPGNRPFCLDNLTAPYHSFRPENGGNIFVRNVGIRLQHCTVSQSRRVYLSVSLVGYFTDEWSQLLCLSLSYLVLEADRLCMICLETLITKCT